MTAYALTIYRPDIATHLVLPGADTPALPNGSVLAAHLSAAAKQSVLQAKVFGKRVQTADQGNPSATTVNIKTALGFDVTAGVDPEGVVKGKCALLEAAGGVEYNTSTSKVGTSAKARSAMVWIQDANGNEIVDSAGKTVWGVITCSARTIAGTYTLRFYSGEFGSGSEATYSMGVAFVMKYPQIFDLDDMPIFGDDVGFVDAEAAVLAPGQISTTQLATGAATAAKLATDSVQGIKIDQANTFRAFHFTGLAAPGAVTATGAKVGDKVLMLTNISDAANGATSYESTITVNDQIQQSDAGDLTTKKFSLILLARS